MMICSRSSAHLLSIDVGTSHGGVKENLRLYTMQYTSDSSPFNKVGMTDLQVCPRLSPL